MTMAAATIIDDALVPIIVVPSVMIGLPLAIGYARLLWKRASDDRPRRAIGDAETSHRLLQMQQSIDAMAIEIERISEGQRFVTKVLSERQQAGALPAGEARDAPPARR